MLLRADHVILIHNGFRHCELIFHDLPSNNVFINDNSPVRKNYLNSNIEQNENARIWRCLQMDIFEADMARS